MNSTSLGEYYVLQEKLEISRKERIEALIRKKLFRNASMH
jgi:hypothetical protein